jgi:divalent metal cation (Fe/Co/Zn/Cd) transporter
MWPFKLFLLIHITTGAVGLVLFWVPVIGRKGGANHRTYGRAFSYLMLVTASMAFGMGLCTILYPVETHPHLTQAASWIQGIFGWMMLYLAILTVSLVWHGLVTIRNKRDHLANRRWPNVALNLVVIVAALNCAWRGWLIDETLMMGIAVVGVASGLTNLWFIYSAAPAKITYQLEHVKAAVGAGISVYTAFMAFGFVRLMPSNALNPKMWSIPLVVGLAIIIYHQMRIRLSQRRPAAVSAQRV